MLIGLLKRLGYRFDSATAIALDESDYEYSEQEHEQENE
jgi:hypothetical protein